MKQPKPGHHKPVRAIAINYDIDNIGKILAGDEAKSVPSIAAKGSDLEAKRIIKLAKRYRIPIVRKRGKFVDDLFKLERDAPIPSGLFRGVAVILMEIFKRRR